MTDKEKVLKGLECCCAMSGHECRQCPYSDECIGIDQPYGMAHLCGDALVLLKAQEPRVLTLEEVKRLQSLKDGAVWIETFGGAVFPALPEILASHISYFVAIPFNNYRSWVENEYYSKTWRCWSARPTDEQREATPWE